MDPEHITGTALPPLRVSLMRMALRVAIVFLVAWGVYMGTMWALQTSQAILPEAQAGMFKWGLLGLLVLTYVVLIAIPFVPGIEIGISLLVIGGATIAPVVYLATFLGLSLAFLIGASLPYKTLHRFFADLRMRRICALLDDLRPLSREERRAALEARLPGRLPALAFRSRYVLLAVLLNTPGNVVLGGGGGICLMAGTSRVFSPMLSLAVIGFAVLPVPLAVWLLGTQILPGG